MGIVSGPDAGKEKAQLVWLDTTGGRSELALTGVLEGVCTEVLMCVIEMSFLWFRIDQIPQDAF